MPRQSLTRQTKLQLELDLGFGESIRRKRVGHAVQISPTLNRVSLELPQKTYPSNTELKKNTEGPVGIMPASLGLIGM